MSRIKNTFERLKKENKKALITFITGGDPDYETSLELFKSLPENGADIIELGMPFSDPMADGEAIQKASIRALANGADMKQTLKMVKEFRKGNQETPIILMGYYNPVYAYGVEDFCKKASEAGIDGLIIVDLPPEEDEELRIYADNNGISIIRLITPTTDENRLKIILNGAGGFLYYVSITGVTGTASADINKITLHIEMIKKYTTLPVAVGFGIKTSDDVKVMARISDAVVVGSVLVKEFDTRADSTAISEIQNIVRVLSKAV